MTTRAQIVAEARTWLSTRWQHQASLKGVGTDCIGLIVGVARTLGIPEAAQFDACAEIKGYGREPEPGMLLRACSAFLTPCRAPIAGDILLMRFVAEPQHFGIISAPDYMIHAYAQARRVVENRIDAVWRDRIVGAYSYRGIA
jgi:NlpC/P60 family putative phage cell wall peptidase